MLIRLFFDFIYRTTDYYIHSNINIMEFNNTQVRRQDRLLDETRSFEILKEGEYGILSMRTENGTVPTAFLSAMYGIEATLFIYTVLR